MLPSDSQELVTDSLTVEIKLSNRAGEMFSQSHLPTWGKPHRATLVGMGRGSLPMGVEKRD